MANINKMVAERESLANNLKRTLKARENLKSHKAPDNAIMTISGQIYYMKKYLEFLNCRIQYAANNSGRKRTSNANGAGEE